MEPKRDPSLEQLAASLELAAEDASARCVGVAFAAFTRTVDLDVTAPTKAEPDAVEGAVREHLEAWESLAPDQFATQWKTYATDPYVGVGPGWVGIIDDATVQEWLASEELAAANESHPPHSPRKVTLTNLALTHLAPGRVLAVYRAEETYLDGKVSAGNTFAVLMHTAATGWRIVVASKGTRHEAPLRE